MTPEQKLDLELELADLEDELYILNQAEKANKRSATRLPKQIDETINKIEEIKNKLKQI